MSFAHRLDDLVATALDVADDIRADVPQAHRTIRALDRLELEQLVCTLAAMVDPVVPLNVMAWWRLDLPTPRRTLEAAA